MKSDCTQKAPAAKDPHRGSRLRAIGFAIGTTMLLAIAGCEDEDGGPAVTAADAAVDAGGLASADAALTPAPDASAPVVDAAMGGVADAATSMVDAVAANAEAGPTDATPQSPDAGAPLYLVAGTIFGATNVTYAVPVRSLAAGTSVDYSKGLEITGGGGVYGPERAGHFFVGLGEAPTLTRYEVSPEGALTKGKSLSFASHGLSNALVNNSGAVFLSPTKAYFIHQEDLKAVVWNPSTMEIQGPLALPAELKKEGFVVVFDGKAQRQGNDLYLIATWANYKDGRYPAGAMLVTIDTSTNTVVSKEADSRCSQVFDSMRHPNGDLYYACSTWSAATHRVLGAEYAAESCLLRIRRGERRFDPDFYVKLPTLTGGQVAGTLVPGRGTEGFVRVLDEKLFPIKAASTVDEVTGAEAWRWWRLDLDKLTAMPTDLAPSAAGATELSIDGATYTSLSKADFSGTTLIEMTATGGPRLGLVARGYVHTGLRLH